MIRFFQAARANLGYVLSLPEKGAFEVRQPKGRSKGRETFFHDTLRINEIN